MVKFLVTLFIIIYSCVIYYYFSDYLSQCLSVPETSYMATSVVVSETQQNLTKSYHNTAELQQLWNYWNPFQKLGGIKSYVVYHSKKHFK